MGSASMHAGGEQAELGPSSRSFVLHGFILAMLVIYAAPIIGVAADLRSRPTPEIAARGVWHIPENASLDNFTEVWTNTPDAAAIWSTASWSPSRPRSSRSSAACCWATSSASSSSRFAELLFLVVIAGMFFPPQAMLIPLFRLFNSPIEIAGFQILPVFFDTVYPMIIIHMSLGLAITTLLLRNFMSALPSGLREAAIVDGAGEWSVLFRVIVPLLLPALAVLATLQFTWIWNDFLWPLVLTRSEEAKHHHGRHQRAQGPVQRGLGQPGGAWPSSPVCPPSSSSSSSSATSSAA